MEEGSLWQRFCGAVRTILRMPEVRAVLQFGQFIASLLFVILYVWSTYSTPAPFSIRYNLDLMLCVLFATEFLFRLAEAESKTRMLCSVWNVLDFVAFFPPLLELALMYGANLPFRLGRFDLRWFKILRALRVMRISLLAGEMRTMHLSSSGALLSGAASIRLYQLVASVLTLLFTTSAIVHLVERIPFFDALYFVTTTLTTVGYGDVVVSSTFGKAAVLAMICVGVVLIPVQTSQLYAQLTARRVTLGTLPGPRTPMVLVGTRLSEVRGFSDFFSEFFTALRKVHFPPNLRMVVLCTRPNYELRAFQELNDRRLTLAEGSCLSERDLVRTSAHCAAAILLLADRFSPSAHQEDLGLQFQVWAVKSYTKSVPVYVQVLRRDSLRMLAPFLDPDRDVLVSVEQMRHRLLALSCLCPGASTLIANLLRRASVLAPEVQPRTAAGRRWLRAYLNGCAFKVFDTLLPEHLAGRPFCDLVEWLYRTSNFVLIGVMAGKKVVLNPGRRRLKGGESGVFMATSHDALDEALKRPFSRPLHPSDPRHQLDVPIPAGMPDSDDYFLEDAEQLCMPDIPDDINAESDSIDLDDVPCRIVEDPSSSSASSALATSAATSASVSTSAAASAPESKSAATSALAAAGSEAPLENAEARRPQPSLITPAHISRIEEAVDMHRDAALGHVPLAKAADAIRATAAAAVAAARTDSRIFASESYDDDDFDPNAHGEELEADEDGSDVTRNSKEESSSATPAEESFEARQSEAAEAATAEYEDKGEGFVEDYMEERRQSTSSDAVSTSGRDDGEVAGPLGEVEGHVIVCGAEASFVNFVEQLRWCDPMPTPIVLLCPKRPAAAWPALRALGPVHWVAGVPSDGASLRAARAKHARALAYLAHSSRPSKGDSQAGDNPEWASVRDRAVLADAEGLLTCYGVGEESSAALTHAVIELCFTSSVRFLQPGLLLQGMGGGDAAEVIGAKEPRKSWQMRKRQERAALKEGLAEWQANPYYCAGRVTVPAIIDTLSASFFNRAMLTSLMTELAGDDGRAGGALLRQVDVGEDMVGRTYGELFAQLALQQRLIPLGLYRRKSENPAWRLNYTVTNPPWHERLEPADKVFVLRERGGPWMA
ncbi:probable potassium channel subfamily T member 2 at N-terminal half [Coccomyxa sp. Obi]|nr:probable potassium channel subfamily T member 2 at N-terminal half [Coccomyxa sp. Obi]